jgi:hypothetical protein
MSKGNRRTPTIAVVLATVFVLGIVTSAQAREHKECSIASLEGSFGFTSIGTLVGLPPPLAGPFAEVGRQTFDGKGNTDAPATASVNGNIKKLTLHGTYVVSPDCTGAMTLFVFELGGSFDADFVIDDDGEELRVLVHVAPGSVESREYRKQFRRGREE